MKKFKWPDSIIRWSAITVTVVVVTHGLWASATRASVQDDAYASAGIWRSYADYLERRLWVPGLSASNCTGGVIYLGDELYLVPMGIANTINDFWMKFSERGET